MSDTFDFQTAYFPNFGIAVMQVKPLYIRRYDWNIGLFICLVKYTAGQDITTILVC